MSIHLACTHCGRQGLIPDEYQGRRIRCKSCGNYFTASGTGMNSLQESNPSMPTGTVAPSNAEPAVASPTLHPPDTTSARPALGEILRGLPLWAWSLAGMVLMASVLLTLALWKPGPAIAVGVCLAVAGWANFRTPPFPLVRLAFRSASGTKHGGPLLAGAFLIIGLVVFAVSLANLAANSTGVGRSDSGVGRQSFRPTDSGVGKQSFRPMPGEECRLAMPDGGNLLVAVHQQAFDALDKHLMAKDDVGVQILVAEGKALLIDSGTRARVISTGLFTYEVRLLDGKHTGRSVLVHAPFLSSVK